MLPELPPNEQVQHGNGFIMRMPGLSKDMDGIILAAGQTKEVLAELEEQESRYEIRKVPVDC